MDNVKPPAAAEIRIAREAVRPIDGNAYRQQRADAKRTMADWDGGGWHTDEIYLGILIGMQIADAREGNNAKEAT